MIAKLTGVVDSVGTDWVVVDVNGVGYQVACSNRTLSRMTVGERRALVVETFIRDDRITLYGFADSGERDWFRLLTTIQGVGSRLALSILGVLDPDQLTRAIAAQDKTALTRADGVGPKVAARIVNELKDKVGNLTLGASAAAAPAAGGKAAPAAGGPDNMVMADAVSALVNLGYGRSEAFGAVVAAGRKLGDGAGVSELIRHGLKELSQ
ncbi:Holliday junction branch migration protein RuvA [Azospirillum baldaniorum]|uniref:Holliday junction branch migration complex subunit RuvA n=1 Tax=Azospirillum baldaniorum TaxID=1064539 RepID=A0A9P1JRC9_9PROT|nr:Holliday junction branch migration protein RuvA [Azospirillum baldaniorum]AWJ89520.1 Holliday junction branch migration protein RuvA [Azospirillum baldaniorum]TWA72057.1 Holliday junction DNA helicase subunit RuvA [Azospirillum baldaniorum]TWA76598.1 Holliday junction DNA helicase subunit RuvA [Azospirillum brasilense]CCC98281.1 Holliday junction DNA helicase ruvA [Azospirillum baldaniorum]